MHIRQKQVVSRSIEKLIFSTICSLIFLLSLISHARADTVTGSGNWLYATYYCGSGVCVPILINHTANVSLDRYSITSGWVIYRQVFGGSLYPNSSICGNHNWLRGQTYYKKGASNEVIGNWSLQSSFCYVGATCPTYASNESHSVYPGNSGNFESIGTFTTRCAPPGVPKTVTVGF